MNTPAEELNTICHEAFARAVAQGVTACDAYLENVSKSGNRNTAASAGPKLARNPAVKARISFFRENLVATAAPAGLLTQAERRAILASIARNESVPAPTRVSAVRADAELAGDVDQKLVIEFRTI
jgi:hypothetical protein